MKILYFVGSEIGGRNGNIGGDPSQVRGMIDGLKKLNHKVLYASVNPEKYMDKQEYLFENINEYNLPVPKVRGFINQWKINKQIEKIIDNYNPDVIFCFWPLSLFVTRLMRYKIPIIMVCNMPWSMNDDNYMNSFYDKKNLRTANLVLTVSDDMTNFIKTKFDSLLGNKVLTNPNRVNIEQFTSQPNNIRELYRIKNEVPVIGFSGYFAPWHRIDILIKAVQEIEHDVKLLLIGNGPEELEKELKFISSQRNRERIIFTGPIPFNEVAKYYSACDILVVPQDKSQAIRSPIKLFEYMSMGKGVAASNVGQLAQIIQDGENGLLFEPDKDSLRDCLARLITDQDMRVKLGKQARRDAVEKYSWDANLAYILSLITIKT